MVTRNDVTRAVQQLRKHFGETQQQFADRLRTAVVTIARWETSRPPSGTALEQLNALARKENLAECVEVFQHALSGDIEPAPAPASAHKARAIFQNDREKVLVMTLLSALRSPKEYGAVVKSVETALRRVLEDYKTSLDGEGGNVPMARSVVLLHNRGDRPERIAELLEMNVDTVEKILMLDLCDLLPVVKVVKMPVKVRRLRGRTPDAEIKRRVVVVAKKRRRSLPLSKLLESCLNREVTDRTEHSEQG